MTNTLTPAQRRVRLIDRRHREYVRQDAALLQAVQMALPDAHVNQNTVDAVTSRLLDQGYGLSRKR